MQILKGSWSDIAFFGFGYGYGDSYGYGVGDGEDDPEKAGLEI